MHDETFNIQTVTLTMPGDIRPDVVADWIVGCYTFINVVGFGNINSPAHITVTACDGHRLNNFLQDLQGNRRILRRRSAEVDRRGWAEVLAHGWEQ